jgi:CO/xanthine dehydrogenase Mo-binding subunit
MMIEQTMPTVPTRERPDAPVTTPGKVGEHTERADGVPKVKGEFEYSSDLWMDGMLWGATLRSPHPHANIWSIDTSEAGEMPGVHAVLTHEDVPGRKVYGMEVPDQPVLAWERIRYQGEPVAIVAADHPETARRALEKISIEYEVLDPLTDPEEAMKEDAPRRFSGPSRGSPCPTGRAGSTFTSRPSGSTSTRTRSPKVWD